LAIAVVVPTVIVAPVPPAIIVAAIVVAAAIPTVIVVAAVVVPVAAIIVLALAVPIAAVAVPAALLTNAVGGGPSSRLQARPLATVRRRRRGARLTSVTVPAALAAILAVGPVRPVGPVRTVGPVRALGAVRTVGLRRRAGRARRLGSRRPVGAVATAFGPRTALSVATTSVAVVGSGGAVIAATAASLMLLRGRFHGRRGQEQQGQSGRRQFVHSSLSVALRRSAGEMVPSSQGMRPGG
jgi:hypothetical protein